jgi:hypothetical protein
VAVGPLVALLAERAAAKVARIEADVEREAAVVGGHRCLDWVCVLLHTLEDGVLETNNQ